MSISPWKPGGCLLVPFGIIALWVCFTVAISWAVMLFQMLPDAWK